MTVSLHLLSSQRQMTIKALLCLLAIGLTAIVAETTVSVGKMTIKESKVHPGNVLPSFLFSQGTVEGGGTQVVLGGGKGTLRPFTPDDSVADDIWEGAMDDVRSPQLPYLTQDQWGCEKEDTDIDVVVLENEYLKVNIAPSVGGKIWSVFDKANNEEMVMNPKVHQPANIGALKAWAPGGIEVSLESISTHLTIPHVHTSSHPCSSYALHFPSIVQLGRWFWYHRPLGFH